jgi:CHAT domain-containing protein
LRELYASSDVLLIAAHGEQSEKSTWESSLLLQPPLKVLDLARMQSNASLVVFEACVSGLVEDTAGSDLIGFSHTVLASGASAFLGDLCKISDEASALLMTFLFDELARCWRNAQIRLYDLDAEGTVEILGRILNDCGTAQKVRLYHAGSRAQAEKDIKDNK